MRSECLVCMTKMSSYNTFVLLVSLYVSTHYVVGCVPKVTVTHLKSAARPNDTKLVLVDHVDWKPGDEVVICGGGPRSAQKQEEVVTVKTVNGTELSVSSPLRYFFSRP